MGPIILPFGTPLRTAIGSDLAPFISTTAGILAKMPKARITNFLKHL